MRENDTFRLLTEEQAGAILGALLAVAFVYFSVANALGRWFQ